MDTHTYVAPEQHSESDQQKEQQQVQKLTKKLHTVRRWHDRLKRVMSYGQLLIFFIGALLLGSIIGIEVTSILRVDADGMESFYFFTICLFLAFMALVVAYFLLGIEEYCLEKSRREHEAQLKKFSRSSTPPELMRDPGVTIHPYPLKELSSD